MIDTFTSRVETSEIEGVTTAEEVGKTYESNRGRYDGGRGGGRRDDQYNEADQYRQGPRGGRFADDRTPKRKYDSDKQSPWEDSELPPPRRKVSPGSAEHAKKQRLQSEEAAPNSEATDKLRANLKVTRSLFQALLISMLPCYEGTNTKASLFRLHCSHPLLHSNENIFVILCALSVSVHGGASSETSMLQHIALLSHFRALLHVMLLLLTRIFKAFGSASAGSFQSAPSPANP
eukprot:694601-Prorocentrum_minimum.AAC.2